METRGHGVLLAVFVSRRCRALLLVVLLMLISSGDSDRVSPKTFTVPSETCGYIVDHGDQFKVQTKRVPDADKPDKTSYLPNISCSIIFRSEPGISYFLRLSEFEIEASRFCSRDGLYIYDGGREDETKLLSANKHALCGTTLSLPNYFVSTGNEITLKFVTDAWDNSYRGFTMFITPFTDSGDCNGFTCTLSRRCVTRDAWCNGEYQCKDGSDEPPNCHLRGTGFGIRSSWPVLVSIVCTFLMLRWIFEGVLPFP